MSIATDHLDDDEAEGTDWQANGGTVDNYGVDHAMMNICMNTYDEAHGAGACAELKDAGYRCRAYFCRPGSDYYGFCDLECSCNACATGVPCGSTRCVDNQVCSCDDKCESASRVGKVPSRVANSLRRSRPCLGAQRILAKVRTTCWT